ncbi:MAG: hypothetical protein J6X94_02620 [Lachnospiraceae bacterium]|nr:hypothetical protein [Lachnospiraceae bacterium]
MKRTLIKISAILAAVFCIIGLRFTVNAAPVKMADGQLFDAAYYASRNPDVVAVFGTDQNMLYLHYALCGKTEGRLPYDPSYGNGGSSSSNSFDAAYYAAKYPDVAAVFGYDPVLLKMHYDLCGKAEGRFANAAEEAVATPAAPAPSAVTPAPAPAPVSTVNDSSFEMQVLNLCNQQRAAYGLAPLSWDASNLAPGAAVRAQEITALFSHTRPDGSSCFTAVRNPGRLGENIAAGQRTPAEVVDDWMNSPGHRANILNGKFTKLGVGYVYVPGDMYGHYWVQMFSS